MRRHGVVPHVAFQVGWGRLSCMTCISVRKTWATLRTTFPARFERVAEREAAFGVTIVPGRSIREIADSAAPIVSAVDDPLILAQAEDPEWRLAIRIDPRLWTLPFGA